jgi:succinate dehydrogenase / fumarate reductase cytochrome b subunit
MFEVFQNPIVVVLYVLGVIALAYHLFHGFHSAFRTMGVHNKKYLALLKTVGYGFTIIVAVLFILMPVSMFFQWVSPN